MARKRPPAKNKKLSLSMKEHWKNRRNGIKTANPNKTRTNLSFLGDLIGNRVSKWNLETAGKLIQCMKNDMYVDEYGGYRWDAKLAAKATGLSETSCTLFLGELKKANAEGMSMEQMFKLGRPFRPGRKVLA